MASGVDFLLQQIQALKRKLASPSTKRSVLRRWGAILSAESQAAFQKQGFDGRGWPELYKGVKRGRFLNIAGALSDFSLGKKQPKFNRYQDRPALQDTNTLGRSISANLLDDNNLEIGSNLSYAGLHQSGGESRQEISNLAKEGIARFLFGVKGQRWVKEKLTPLVTGKGNRPFSKSKYRSMKNAARQFVRREKQIVQRIPSRPVFLGYDIAYKDGRAAFTKSSGVAGKARKAGHQVKKVFHGKTAIGRLVKGEPMDFFPALFPLLTKTTLITAVHPRPFVGVTKTAASDMVRAAEEVFGK